MSEEKGKEGRSQDTFWTLGDASRDALGEL